MPTVAALAAGLIAFVPQATVDTGLLAPRGNLLQAAIDGRVEALADRSGIDRNTYTDTGRTEDYDGHRKSLADELLALTKVRGVEAAVRKAEAEAKIAEHAAEIATQGPFEFYTDEFGQLIQ